MIAASTFRGKNMAVFGLARSGVTTALSLQAGGAKVFAFDDNEEACKVAESAGVTVTDLREIDWSSIDGLVLSPGVPHDLPEPHWSAKLAKKYRIPIICDVEIFAREVMARAEERRPKIIAVTGTNGKSTTTALIGHILDKLGRNAQIGGNIGRGVLDLGDMHRNVYYVLELSSYQLERTNSLKANAAVFLNLTPDHLDRHGDMKAYEQAKCRIFKNQTKGDAAIVGVDGREGKSFCTSLLARNNRRVIPISGRRSLGRGVCVVKGKLYSVMDKSCEFIADLTQAAGLDGEHNWQNAAAAFAAIRSLGLDAKAVGKAILGFPGLEHRMETVGQVESIKFINDSKATNANAAAQALKTYDNIYWISGGFAKDGGIEDLAMYFSKISHAYLIGKAARGFSKTLKAESVQHKISGELKMAVLCATRDALASRTDNPVVLLSPACASFDQFEDFEVRGNAFRAQVQEIVELFERESAQIQMAGNAA